MDQRPKPAHKGNDAPRNARVAVFIDYENVFYGSLHNAQCFPACQIMMDKAKTFGKINLAVAICDWTRLPKGIPHVVSAGITPVFSCHAMTGYQTAPGGGKEKYAGKQSSSDSHMFVQVFETILHYPDIEVYVIISGDRDFVPLVSLLRRQNKYVVVMSEEVSMSWDMKASSHESFTFQEIGALVPATDRNASSEANPE
jgi:uncharacterized LabA/DUF88 family protein